MTAAIEYPHEATMDDKLLTTKQVAAMWAMEPASLENQRYRGEGCPFVKLPGGAVRYRTDHVLEAMRDGVRGLTRDNVREALQSFRGHDIDVEAILDHVFREIRRK